MHAISFVDHWGDFIVAGIVLEMAFLGAKNGFFRGVILGLQSLAAFLFALALSGRFAAWLAHLAIPSTTVLGVSFLSILAMAAIGIHFAIQRLIAGRSVRLSPTIDTVGGGLAGGVGGFSFAGAILIALSMLPMPAAMRVNTSGMALDAGSKMLETFARCLVMKPSARDRLLESYRLAAWIRPPQPPAPDPTPEPATEPTPAPEGDPVADEPSVAFKWGFIPVKNLSHWEVESGNWTVSETPKDRRPKPGTAGRIRGNGNSRLRLRYAVPDDMTLSFKMQVREGSMRPAVFLSGTNVDVWVGNSGLGHTLSLHGNIKPKRTPTPMRYAFGEVYDVSLTVVEQRATLRIDAQEIASATLTEQREDASEPSRGLWLTLSSGNESSEGEAEFWDLRISKPIRDRMPTLP